MSTHLLWDTPHQCKIALIKHHSFLILQRSNVDISCKTSAFSSLLHDNTVDEDLSEVNDELSWLRHCGESQDACFLI